MLQDYIKLSKIELIKIINEKNVLVEKMVQEAEDFKSEIEKLNEDVDMLRYMSRHQ